MHDKAEYTIFGVHPLNGTFVERYAYTLDDAVKQFVRLDHPEHSAKVWSKAKQGFILQSFLRSYAHLKGYHGSSET